MAKKAKRIAKETKGTTERVKQVKDQIQQDLHHGTMLKCPHCGKRINPLFAWGIKAKGEYQCPDCQQYASIRLSLALYIMGILSVFVAFLLLVIFILTGSTAMWLIFLMAVPFLVFTLSSPFLLRFTKVTQSEIERSYKRNKVVTTTEVRHAVQSTPKNSTQSQKPAPKRKEQKLSRE